MRTDDDETEHKSDQNGARRSFEWPRLRPEARPGQHALSCNFANYTGVPYADGENVSEGGDSNEHGQGTLSSSVAEHFLEEERSGKEVRVFNLLGGDGSVKRKWDESLITSSDVRSGPHAKNATAART